MKKRILSFFIVTTLLLTACGSKKSPLTDSNTEEENIVMEDNAQEDNIQEDSANDSIALEEALPLKTIYEDNFYIGVALNPRTIGDTYVDTILTHFNSITCENEMKPDYILDKTESISGVGENQTFVAVNFKNCESLVSFCETQNIKMRLHTLVWHAQTPEWFFHEDYDTSKPLTDAETMRERMHQYISQVISYFDTNHPGLIYAVDVVNEAFNGDGEYKIKDTDNRWYDILGADYVYYAFLYAKEAVDSSSSMQDVALVYNDYGMMYKVDTVVNGLASIFEEHDMDVHQYVDTIGLQSHLDTNTSMKNFCKSLKRFSDAGYEIQITELDIGIPDLAVGKEPTEKQLETQGRKYKYLMEDILALMAEGCKVTSVTVWGISDDNSWRKNSDGKDARCLLWAEGMVEKPALRGMALCSDVTSYYTYGLDY